MTGPDDHLWLDAEAGPVVRLYTVTAGRARPDMGRFEPTTLVVATAAPLGDLQSPTAPEQFAALAFLRRPTTVAEVVLHLGLPLGVVRVLLGDLLRDGLIAPYESSPADRHRILQTLRDGLQAL